MKRLDRTDRRGQEGKEEEEWENNRLDERGFRDWLAVSGRAKDIGEYRMGGMSFTAFVEWGILVFK